MIIELKECYETIKIWIRSVHTAVEIYWKCIIKFKKLHMYTHAYTVILLYANESTYEYE
jgi:hypothetical protein